MVETGNVFLINVAGCFLLVAGLAFMSILFYRGSQRKFVAILLIAVTFTGILLFGLSSSIIMRATNLGKPIQVKNLSEKQELEMVFWTPIFSVVRLQEDIRIIAGLGYVADGKKFYVYKGKIYEEFPKPEESPKISI